MRSCTGTPDNDLDHADWLNPVEPADYCDHGQRGATCGKCAEFDTTPLTSDEIEAELQRVVLKRLAEIDAKRGTK